MAFIDEWRRWHDSRMAALGAPYGPLTSVRDDDARPGTKRSASCFTTDRAALLQVPFATPDDVLALPSLTGQQQHLLEAEGSHLFEDRAFGPRFAGVEVFEPHHDWVVPAEVVDPALAGDDADASVHFELDGVESVLVVTRQPRGAFHAVFSDPTRGTRFPQRNLYIPAPDDGSTTIDFNRAVLPLAAFSPRFPAADEPVVNHLAVAVTAGEHRAYCAVETRPIAV